MYLARPLPFFNLTREMCVEGITLTTAIRYNNFKTRAIVRRSGVNVTRAECNSQVWIVTSNQEIG